MDENMKEVYFTYCNTCKHKDADQADDICHECLNTPARQYSHKPINWEKGGNNGSNDD